MMVLFFGTARLVNNLEVSFKVAFYYIQLSFSNRSLLLKKTYSRQKQRPPLHPFDSLS
jgi:hypothetical protein